MKYKGLTVLVVEDNNSIRLLMEQMLTQIGVGRVITATQWYEVQSAIEGVDVHGAFVDLVLQHGSGLDVARSLKSKNIPIVFCSGVDDEYNQRQMYALGFFFKKPVTMYALDRGLEYFRQLKGVDGE